MNDIDFNVFGINIFLNVVRVFSSTATTFSPSGLNSGILSSSSEESSIIKMQVPSL